MSGVALLLSGEAFLINKKNFFTIGWSGVEVVSFSSQP